LVIITQKNYGVGLPPNVLVYINRSVELTNADKLSLAI